MVPVKLQLFLVYPALISVAVCSDASFLNIIEWRNTIPHERERDGRIHTLDLNDGPAEGCTPLPMDDDRRITVVNIHNELRRKVAKGLEERGKPGPQPSAKHMLEMEYDLNLERVAMAWVSQCKFAHDSFRTIDGYNFVGQNIQAISYKRPPDIAVNRWESHALAWYDEVDDFDKDLVANYTIPPNVTVGHYVQVVTDIAHRIGCAEALSKTLDDEPWFKFTAICNYASGVYVDSPVYETGVPCEGVDEEDCNDGLVIYKGPAEGCTPLPMDDDQRMAVVNSHNELRRKVAKGLEERGKPGPQPSAKHMLEMEYDLNLERVAMAWVSQCKFERDPFRTIDGYNFVGQNLRGESSSGPSEVVEDRWERHALSWYSEVDNFDKDLVANFTRPPNVTVGHYVQIVHDLSNGIGCAEALSRTPDDKQRILRIAVCNYASGVYITRPVYEAGVPCEGVDEEHCNDGLVITKNISDLAAVTPNVPSLVNITEWRNTIPHVKERNGYPHTLELNDGPAEGCTPREMTAEERILVTKLHNDKRRQVAKGTEISGDPGPQPPASNMMKLEYDEDLEHVAMAWISQCPPRRDKYRDIEPFDSVGQIFLINGGSHPETDWEQIINHWYDQVADFNGMDAIEPQEDPRALLKGDTGSYAQMVQAHAYRVGCAVATTSDSTASKQTRVVACNYGRLHTDSRLYKKGQPCSGVNEKCDDGLIMLGEGAGQC